MALKAGQFISAAAGRPSILQLFTSKSVDQTVTIFSSMLELMSHRLDLAYQTLRFLVWIIPTTGFIGTVIGIAIALEAW